MERSKRWVGIGMVLVIVIAVCATWAWASGNDEIYYACVSKSSGTIKMVGPDEPCKNNEYRIRWNSRGPPGPEGRFPSSTRIALRRRVVTRRGLGAGRPRRNG